jgi:transcriptional regulator with XRE-family HTH domain
MNRDTKSKEPASKEPASKEPASKEPASKEPAPGPAAETWPEYLRRVSAGATQAQIAGRIGVGRLSVCNWLRGKTHPKAETVIDVARAYRRSPVEALIAARYLEPSEAAEPVVIRASLADACADDLGAEVSARLADLARLSAAPQIG